MQHHAYVVEGSVEEGVARAKQYAHKELGVVLAENPDIVVLTYGLLSVEEARKVAGIASQGAIGGGKKVIIIAAARAYHEAQNALLKLFEEPPPQTYLFLVLPSLGGLLPTLRSRVVIIAKEGKKKFVASEMAEQFLTATRERRGALIKKLTSGKDEESRRENRDEAIAILNAVEAAAYAAGVGKHQELLAELATLREYLHTPSAPLKMILEHVAIVAPRSAK